MDQVVALHAEEFAFAGSKLLLACDVGFQGGLASPQQAEAWPAAALPHQAVLHLKHANHSAISLGVQLVLHLSAVVQALRQLPAGQAARALGGRFLDHHNLDIIHIRCLSKQLMLHWHQQGFCVAA